MEALREAGVIDLDGDKGDPCLMHLGASHDVETCPIVEELWQGMINRGQIEIYRAKKEEGEVCMQSGDRNLSKPKPLVIHFTRDITTQRPRGFQPFTAKMPAPFPYKSDKAVPWKDGLSKREISTEEVTEFLRIIQQSEFKVIEQLNKTPARICLLGLLMNSKPHRALLVKILNEAHVAQDISVESFGGIVNNITVNNCLTFLDEEIPVEGRGHNKALHVSVKSMDHVVAKVLIDNDSSLNVMPKTMLDKLPFDVSHIRPSSMVVRAFDGSQRDVRREIDLPIQIGPHIC